MQLPPNLNVYVSAALFVLGAFLFALYAALLIWTYRDIHARTRDVLAQILAVLLVAIFNLLGLLVYVLIRPRVTLAESYERELTEEAIMRDLEPRKACPKCQRQIEPDFILCPYCHEQLKLRCLSCDRLLDPEWDICPYCGTKTQVDGLESIPLAVDSQQ